MEYDEAVELWARQWGRHGRIEWNGFTNGWVIHLTRKADDPLMKAYRDGVLDHEPTESIPLTMFDPKKGYVSVGLDEIGVGGILDLLDEGNIWSGRGAYESHEDSMNAKRARNDEKRRLDREAQKERGQEMAAQSRRKVFDLPLVPVSQSLSTSTGDSSESA